MGVEKRFAEGNGPEVNAHQGRRTATPPTFGAGEGSVSNLSVCFVVFSWSL